jgi:uncharacterized membrane protein
MSSIITATFKNRIAAEEALTQLEDIGIREEQISLVVTDETRGSSFDIKETNKMDEGAAIGATTLGVVGAVLGSLLAAGVVAIPGLNLVVAGAVISGLAGMGAGAAAGGFVGALVGMGIPEHEAKLYENEVKKGSILVAVKTESSEQKKIVKDILHRNDAFHVAA